MSGRADFDKIEVYLVRVLQTLIMERSVSRTAMRLNSTQPAVSAQLKRLRTLTGDPLLVRTGNSMMPTEAALQMLAATNRILQGADRLFGPRSREHGFEPQTSSTTFRVAASDYLDPWFLPELVVHLKQAAPLARLLLLPLSEGYDYRRSLASGEVDLVIGNWLEPPGELHLGRLLSDEVVCLVASDHPATRGEAWNIDAYLAAEHIAPTPLHARDQGAAPGVIDEHLATLGLAREIAVRTAHFSLIPLMVARSQLVLTTGRLFCSRYVDNLPVRIVRCPVAFPTLTYYQLWHDLVHASASVRWLREQVRDVARGLAARPMPQAASAADAALH